MDFNVLCTVNAANEDIPLEVYRYFRDDLGARFIQFIPIVERDNDTGFQEGDTVTERSVDPEAWGRFLVACSTSGSAGCGHRLRLAFRRGAGLVGRRAARAVHLRRDVRQRGGARAQRRPLLL